MAERREGCEENWQKEVGEKVVRREEMAERREGCEVVKSSRSAVCAWLIRQVSSQ